MRLLWGLAALTLVWSLCGNSTAQPKEVGLPQPPALEFVTGSGETADGAKNAVARAAVKDVTDLMEKHGLHFFKIDEKYAREHLLSASGKWGEDFPIRFDDGDKKIFKRWIVPLRTDIDWWKEIVRRDRAKEREVVAEQRQTWTYRFMIGLSLLLLSGFGYVRLDEYTHRRYTKRLRVLGVGVAGTAVAVWWWVLQGGW